MSNEQFRSLQNQIRIGLVVVVIFLCFVGAALLASQGRRNREFQAQLAVNMSERLFRQIKLENVKQRRLILRNQKLLIDAQRIAENSYVVVDRQINLIFLESENGKYEMTWNTRDRDVYELLSPHKPLTEECVLVFEVKEDPGASPEKMGVCDLLTVARITYPR